MRVRDRIVSGIGLATIYASLAFGYGGVLDAAGKPCEKCQKKGETQGGDEGDGGKDNSDPINLSTGDYQLAQTDLMIPGRGLNFEFKRFYRSFSGLQTVDSTASSYAVNIITNNRVFSDRGDINGPTSIGSFWDFNYNMRISTPVPDSDPDYEPGPFRVQDGFSSELYPGIIDLMSGNGRIDTFVPYASEDISGQTVGFYHNDDGVVSKKILYRGHQYTISVLDSDMTEYRFYPVFTAMSAGSHHQYAGRLESIVDRNGNTVQFVYELSPVENYPRIDYAIDTLGNHIDFRYYDELDYSGNPAPNQSWGHEWEEHTLWLVADLVNEATSATPTPRRVWQYEYERASGGVMLKSVVLPQIVDDSEFPMGGDSQHTRFDQVGDRKWEFEYVDMTQWEKRLLSKVTNPNGDIILENEYWADMQPGQPSSLIGRNDVRVGHQHYGDGTYSYIASHIDPATFPIEIEGDPVRPLDEASIHFGGEDTGPHDYYVWVNDRRGAITRFRYSGFDIGGHSTGPIHRALIEKVEYEGFVPQGYEDAIVWAIVDSNGGHTWYYIDQADELDQYASPIPFAGPSGTEQYVRTWDWNDNWNPNEEKFQVLHAPPAQPSLDQDSVTYLFDDTSDDPLRWGAMLKRTRNDSNGSGGVSSSIVEDWKYEFDFGGGMGGSGCGCGSDSFVTAYKDGNGNVTLYEYDSTVNATTGRANGNLLKIYHDIPNSTVDNAVASNASSVEEFEYNAYGQMTKHIYAETTTASGTHYREDHYEYESNSSSTNFGRMIKKIVDAGSGGLNLTTDYLYDAVGNLIQVIDPGDDVTVYYYNQDSNLIKEERFNSSMTELFSRVDYYYDANGNVVQEEVANLIPDSGSPGGALIDVDNPSFTTLHKYDVLDFLVATAREHGDMTSSAVDFTSTTTGKIDFNSLATDAAHLAFEEWEYDEAQNLIKHSVGEAANGSDPTVTHFEYDARDLLVRQYFGIDEQSILVDVEFDRDQKGRIEEAHVNPNDPTHVQTYAAQYDGFDRIVGIVDPMGNSIGYEYDNNHNLTRTKLVGPYEVDTAATDTATSVTLIDKIMEYDARDRLKSEKVQVYDYNYGASNGISTVSELVTEYVYNDDDSIKTVSLPTSTGSPNVVSYLYDTASRVATIEDGEGNLLTYAYDADSDVISQTQTDMASDGSGAEQRFTTDYLYDALHRVIKITQDPQNLSLETLFAYDSRSNVVKQTDARGNVTQYLYDGLSRRTHTKTLMTSTGDGTGGALSGDAKYLVREAVYDDAHRVIEEVDDDGNTTSYTFDAMNRLLTTTMPDSAVYTNVYDANNNLSQHTDARGVVINQLFDKNNRMTSRTITYPAGFGNPSVFTDLSSLPTAELYTYDGAGRIRIAENDFTKITRRYDSLSNVVRETQNAGAPSFLPASERVVTYDFDAANNTQEISSPNRTVYRSYDSLNRLAGIFNYYDAQSDIYSNPVIEFEYSGSRVSERLYGNGVVTDYTYTGYQDELNVDAPAASDNFGFGRLSSITTENTGGVIDSFDYAWDQAQNRTRYDHTTTSVTDRRERSFGYDSSDRLIESIVDFPDPLSSLVTNTTSYTLDEVHNRISVSESVVDHGDAGAGIGNYTLNASAPSSNNQYHTAPKIGSSYNWVMLYDENGNLVLQIEDVPGNYNQDGSVNYLDLSDFTAALGANDPNADLNEDGNWDQADVNAFLALYQQGQGTDVERRDYRFDHRNQLVDVRIVNGGDESNTVHTYDPFARRLVETLDDDYNGSADNAQQFVYGCASLWEILERIDLGVLGGGETLLSTHVFGLGIDDEVAYRKEDESPAIDLWSHRDDQNSLTCVTDELGAVLERYQYGDYGSVTITDNAGNLNLSGSVCGALHLYTGRLLLLGSTMYDSRYRILSAELGSFIQRDPLGYSDGMSLFRYASTSPLVFVDPMGLSAVIIIHYDQKFDKRRDFDREQIQEKMQEVLDKCSCSISVLMLPNNKGRPPNNLGLHPEDSPPTYRHNFQYNEGSTKVKNDQAYTEDAGGNSANNSEIWPDRQVINYTNLPVNPDNPSGTDMAQTYANVMLHESIWLGLLGKSDAQNNKWNGYLRSGTANTNSPAKITTDSCKKIGNKFGIKCPGPGNSCDATP